MKTGYESFRAALIGEHLTHSFSPKIHAMLADYKYDLTEIPPDGIGEFLKDGKFDGLNVTIPHKKAVIPFLAELSPEAEKIGAVNIIIRTENGLRGENTDYCGFSYLLTRSGVEIKGKKVLVLGTGGASLTVKAVLADYGAAQIVSVSRSGEFNYRNLYLNYDADVIVNTTPVGMYPHNGEAPLSLTSFPHCSGVFDLIYNPCRTALLCEAESLGIPCFNGLPMLVAQAKRACEIFISRKIDDAEIERIISEIAFETANIVLVGMPGCGKSTAGRRLAEKLSREFVDTDIMAENSVGMKIPEFIEKYGEAEFRRVEHAEAEKAGKLSGAVIATGGGVVTVKENYIPLHANGVIVFLDREPEKLAAKDRPITAEKGVFTLYTERLPLYNEFSDADVKVDDDPEVTAERIIRRIKCGY